MFPLPNGRKLYTQSVHAMAKCDQNWQRFVRRSEVGPVVCWKGSPVIESDGAKLGRRVPNGTPGS
jgi:hypothetical protein